VARTNRSFTILAQVIGKFKVKVAEISGQPASLAGGQSAVSNQEGLMLDTGCSKLDFEVRSLKLEKIFLL